MRLDGKVAIVTGAASGIGEAIVRLYLDAGSRVVAVDREAIPAPPGEGAEERFRVVPGDVGQEETAIAYTRVALDAFGRIDVVVNNAGISVVKPIHEHTPEEWDRVMDVNVKALYWSARQVVPVMKTQREGLFLNTGSISSFVGIPGQGAYATSKGAVVQLTRQMAIEYAADGIRVNAVCPGTVDTPMLRRAAADSGDPAAFHAGLLNAPPSAGSPARRKSPSSTCSSPRITPAS
jgi:NAD(P)-dependent dehydrogenase (short-subunit alcohol dehydrogenase family)